MKGFRQFIENQGIVALAIGFILGSAVSKFVTSFVADIINPVVSGIFGNPANLDTQVFYIGKNVMIHYGSFLNNGIDFIIIAFIVYFGVKMLRIDQEKIGKVDISKVGSFGVISKK